jgi:hypothetical protein
MMTHKIWDQKEGVENFFKKKYRGTTIGKNN